MLREAEIVLEIKMHQAAPNNVFSGKKTSCFFNLSSLFTETLAEQTVAAATLGNHSAQVPNTPGSPIALLQRRVRFLSHLTICLVHTWNKVFFQVETR